MIFALIFQNPYGNLSFGLLTTGFQANPLYGQFSLLSKCPAALRRTRTIPVADSPGRWWESSHFELSLNYQCNFLPHFITLVFVFSTNTFALSPAFTFSSCLHNYSPFHLRKDPLTYFSVKMALLVNFAGSGFKVSIQIPSICPWCLFRQRQSPSPDLSTDQDAHFKSLWGVFKMPLSRRQWPMS